MADLALPAPPCLEPPSIPQGWSLSPQGTLLAPPLHQPQSLPEPRGARSPQGRCPGVPSLAGVSVPPGSPLSPSHRGGDLLCTGWSQLLSQGPTLHSWGPRSIPRCSSLCPGGLQSHQGVPNSLSIGSLPCPRGSHLPFEGPTLYSSYPLLCLEGLYSLQGLSTPHGVLTLSWGLPSLFPVVLLPARGMCSPLRMILLPSRGSTLYPRGSLHLPGGSLLSSGALHSLPGGPVFCSRRPAASLSARSPARGNPLLSAVAPALHLGVAAGSPRTRGAAAAARGGAGAGAHPRCRWRGGAAAPSAIKRAAAPVPQRGCGSS